jgi:polysaccharide pyruvyl transferase WcaK-like protein
MRNQAAFVMPDADSNLSNIGSWFAGCRCVLAMRLHAAVLATAYGKPCLLMPYDQKVIEFGKQFPVVGMASAELLDDRDGFASMLERAATSPVTADPESGEFWNTARLFDS